MATLYEISEEYLNALENIVAEDGTIDTTALEEINGNLQDKVEATALFIKDCEAMAKMIKEEEAALASRRKTLENTVTNLKGYLTDCMSIVNMSKYASPKVAISFRSSKAVEIINEAMIPHELMTEKVTYTPNKTEIKKAIEEGIEVPGAELVERRNIQIK